MIHKIPLLLFCVLLAACGREIPEKPEVSATVRFQVGIPSLLTRSAIPASDKEAIMHTLHVYVYDNETPEGLMESHHTFHPKAAALDAGIKTSYGKKRFVFVANTDVASDWAYEDNASSRDSFVMTASAVLNVSGPAIDLGYLFLERLVSRVEILQIRNLLPSSTGTVQLKGIYLHNVARELGNTRWANDAYWRQDSQDLARVRPLLDGEVSGFLATGGIWDAPSGGYVLYGYPNAAPQSSDDKVRDWVTRLVVELEIKGVTHYYPIGIPDMESNRSYTIRRLDILRSGSPDPDHYVTSDQINFQLIAGPWLEVPINGQEL